MWILNKITAVQRDILHNINLQARVNNESSVYNTRKTRFTRKIHRVKTRFKNSLHNINKKQLFIKVKHYVAEYWQEDHWSKKKFHETKKKLSTNSSSELCTDEIVQLYYAKLSSSQSFTRANTSSMKNESDTQQDKTSFLLDTGNPENTLSSIKTQECLTCLIEEYQFSSECFEKIYECLTQKALVKKYNSSLKPLDIKYLHESVLTSYVTRVENTLNSSDVRNHFLSENLSLKDMFHGPCFYLICKQHNNLSTFKRSLIYTVKNDSITKNDSIDLRKCHHRSARWKKISSLRKAKSLKVVKLDHVNLLENETRTRIVVLTSAVNEYTLICLNKEITFFSVISAEHFVRAIRIMSGFATLFKINANESSFERCSLNKVNYIRRNAKISPNEAHSLELLPLISKLNYTIMPNLEMVTYDDTRICFIKRAKYKQEAFLKLIKRIRHNAFESCPVYLTKAYSLSIKSCVKTAHEIKIESLTKNVTDMLNKDPIKVIKCDESTSLRKTNKANKLRQIRRNECIKTLNQMKNPVHEETGHRCLPIKVRNPFSVNSTTICTKNNDKYIFSGDMVILHIENRKKSHKRLRFQNKNENQSLSANANNNNIHNNYEQIARKKSLNKKANKASRIVKKLFFKDKRSSNVHKIDNNHVICKWVNEKHLEESSKSCPNENNNDERHTVSHHRKQKVRLPCGCQVELKTFKMGMHKVFGKDPGNPTRDILNHHYERTLRELRRKRLIQEYEFVDFMKYKHHYKQQNMENLRKARRLKATNEREKQPQAKVYIVDRSQYRDDSSHNTVLSSDEKLKRAELRMKYYEEIRRKQALLRKRTNYEYKSYLTTPAATKYLREKKHYRRRDVYNLNPDSDSESTISQSSFGSLTDNEMIKEQQSCMKPEKCEKLKAKSLKNEGQTSISSASENFLSVGKSKKDFLTATQDEYVSLTDADGKKVPKIDGPSKSSSKTMNYQEEIGERQPSVFKKFDIKTKAEKAAVDVKKDERKPKPFMTSFTKKFFGPKSSFLSERSKSSHSDTRSTDNNLIIKNGHPQDHHENLEESEEPEEPEEFEEPEKPDKPDKEPKIAMAISDMLIRFFQKNKKISKSDALEMDTFNTRLDKYEALSKCEVKHLDKAFRRTSVYELQNRIIEKIAPEADEENNLEIAGKYFKVHTKTGEAENEISNESLSKFLYEDDHIFPINSKLRRYKEGIKTFINEIKDDCSENELGSARDSIHLIQIYDQLNINEQEPDVPLGREYLIAKTIKDRFLLPGDKVPRKKILKDPADSKNKSNICNEQLDVFDLESIEENIKQLRYVDGLCVTNDGTLNHVNVKGALCMLIGQQQLADNYDDGNYISLFPTFPLQLPILVTENDVMNIKERVNHAQNLEIHQNRSVKQTHSTSSLEYESHIYQQTGNHSKRDICFSDSSADSPLCQCMLHDPYCCRLGTDEPKCQCAGHDEKNTDCRLKLCECKMFKEIEKKDVTHDFKSLQNVQNVKLEVKSESSKASILDQIKGCNTNSAFLTRHKCVNRALKIIKPLETSKISKTEQIVNNTETSPHNSVHMYHNGDVNVHKSPLKSIEYANAAICLSKPHDPSKLIPHLQSKSDRKDKINHELVSDDKRNSLDQPNWKIHKFVKYRATKLDLHNNIQETTVAKVQNRSNKLNVLPVMKNKTAPNSSANSKINGSCQQICISSKNKCLPKISIKSSRRICKIDISNSKLKSSFSLK